MANPPCMNQDGNPATFMGTFLETGDTVAVCDECMVAFTAAVLNTMTGIDPTPFLAAVSDDVEEVVILDDGAQPAADAGTPQETEPPTAHAAEASVDADTSTA